MTAMTPAIIAHVSAGGLGIVSGYAAVAVAKGERLHRVFGTVFVLAMLTMSAMAAYLSIMLQPGTLVGSIFAFYLVATAWATVKRKEDDVGQFERAALAVVLACATADVLSGFAAMRSPTGQFLGYSAPLYFVTTLVMAIAAAGDVKMIRQGGVSGAARIARHLWRMCLALFVAASSFFLGQQKVMPAFLHGSKILLALGLAPLLVLAFWMIRVRFKNWAERDAVAT